VTPRYISCVPLEEVFRDFERAGLNMSWIYGNVHSSLIDAEIPVFAAEQNVYEKVDIHRLRRELKDKPLHEKQWPVSLLGSSLNAKKVDDVQAICRFVLGELDSYDNAENFHLVYDFKHLTAEAKVPFIIPSEIAPCITASEWKSRSITRDLSGNQASIFANANRLSRLHKSTTLHIELANFQIDVTRLAEFLTLLQSSDRVAIRVSPTLLRPEETIVDDDVPRSRGGARKKAWWDEFWVEVVGRIYDGSLIPRSQEQLKQAMKVLADERGWDCGESAMNQPSSLLWKRLQQES
jgi:hypothetical protein